MPRRKRRALRQLVTLVTGLILVLPPIVTAQAPDPPTVAVFHQSLTGGLHLATDDCPDALRSLTGRLFVRSSLTHVSEVGSDRARAPAVAVPRIPPILLAYTLQGPQNEVAILVCAPSALIAK